jgi:MoaA/NifB/PqqE/SkfB family radical SAM enzyme
MRMTSLDLDFTRGCNMNCNHCFADAHTPMQGELSTEEYLDLLDQASAYDLQRVSWGLGGEALTRRDLVPLLHAAAEHGFPQVLTTNGLLITERIAEEIAATGTRVSISIDGATGDTQGIPHRGCPGHNQ